MFKKLLILAALPFLLTAEDNPITVKTASAEIHSAPGGKVSGKVTFTEVNGGINVVADLEGLTPGKHGFHIHEKGDCSAPDFSSAGEHFNPFNSKHGGPDSDVRHVGDLGNIKAGPDGKAHYERVDTLIKLNGANSIIGRAIIVHADADDYVTQPSGNSGKKLGCGVIKGENSR